MLFHSGPLPFALMWSDAVARAFEATAAAASAATENALTLCALGVGAETPVRSPCSPATAGGQDARPSWYRRPVRNPIEEWHSQVLDLGRRMTAFPWSGPAGSAWGAASTWPWAMGLPSLPQWWQADWRWMPIVASWQSAVAWPQWPAFHSQWPQAWPIPGMLASAPMWTPFDYGWLGLVSPARQQPLINPSPVAYRSNSGFAVAPIRAPETAAGLAFAVFAAPVLASLGSSFPLGFG